MADEVPPDVVRQLRSFVSELLDVVLAKVSLTGIIRLFQQLHRFGFADGYQPGLQRDTARPRSVRDAGHGGRQGGEQEGGGRLVQITKASTPAQRGRLAALPFQSC